MLRTCFAFVALLAAACGADPPVAPTPETGRIEAAPGVTLYYERYGDGSDFVIAPGRLFLSESFRSLAAPGRTLVFYDMRNRGASGRVEDGGALNVIEDVNDLEAVRAHFGAERFTPVGFSYLGVMVALYAAEHPARVERIVQIGPAPRRFGTDYPPGETAGADTLPPEIREAEAAILKAREDGAPAMSQQETCALEHAYSRYVLVGDPASIARVFDPCVHENEWPDNLARHFSFHFADIQTRDFPASMFAGLERPVLVVHGTRDRNAPYGAGREWARTFPDARLITVEGGAHAVWADDPGVVGEIDEFLRGAWPARAETIR